MFEKKTSLGAVGGIETKTNGLDAFPPQQPLHWALHKSWQYLEKENCERNQGSAKICERN